MNYDLTYELTFLDTGLTVYLNMRQVEELYAESEITAMRLGVHPEVRLDLA